ncbi:hypothetical protein IH768_29220, partial [Escherichia coli]|nr:hypothetical protein [Escherichia coli]
LTRRLAFETQIDLFAARLRQAGKAGVAQHLRQIDRLQLALGLVLAGLQA